jgi:hypothetical protein
MDEFDLPSAVIEHAVPNAILQGGPGVILGVNERIRHVTSPEITKIKVPFSNRYEHFEATSQTTMYDDHELRVFEWTGRTYVAE